MLIIWIIHANLIVYLKGLAEINVTQGAWPLHIWIYISWRWSTPNIIAFGPLVYMLHVYKVYVNHRDDPCQIVLHLIYWFIRRFILKSSPFWPLSGAGPFVTNLNLFAPRMLHANLKKHFGQWFMRRRFSKLFAIYLFINLYKSKSSWGGAYNPGNFICAYLSLLVRRRLFHTK